MTGSKDTEELFDSWATNGRAEGMERGHRVRAEQALSDMPIEVGEKILDLGCGNGWASRWLRLKTGRFGFVAGIDFSAAMVERAKELSADMYGLQFRRAGFQDLPWSDGFFDHAFSMEALYYAPDLSEALRSVARVLRPGGTLTVCIDFYEENPHCHSWPEQMGVTMHMLTESGWADTLAAAGLPVERTWRCFDPRPVDGDRPEAQRLAEENFRREVGSLALRARAPE